MHYRFKQPAENEKTPTAYRLTGLCNRCFLYELINSISNVQHIVFRHLKIR